MTDNAPQVLSTLIDAADQLQASLSPDDAWERSVAIAAKHGFNALNIMELDTATGGLKWFRSSMKMQWLMDYMEQDFMDVDPLLAGACQGLSRIRMEDGEVVDTSEVRQRSPELGNQMVEWGYRSLETRMFAGDGANAVRGVILAQSEVSRPVSEAHGILCALIKAAVGPPETHNSPGTILYPDPLLSAREADVLCYLAAGLRNDAIAWKLGIAEVTVRAHVKTARQKLGAETREEAIAIAIRGGHLSI